MKSGANDTKLAGDSSAAGTHIAFFRHIVKVDPVAVFPGYNTLGPQNESKGLGIQLL